MQKYLTEILIPKSRTTTVSWLMSEGVQSELFITQVTSKWQALQMRDLRVVAPTRARTSPVFSAKPVVPEEPPANPSGSKKKNRLTPALRATIPPCPRGGGMCLMSYTNRGCNKEDCPWVPWYAGCPPLPAPLQDWLVAVQGSYKSP